MSKNPQHSVYSIVRPHNVSPDGEVRKGNACTARYTVAEATATRATEREWLATFAPAPVAAAGFQLESSAITACADQLHADIKALYELASKLRKEGR